MTSLDPGPDCRADWTLAGYRPARASCIGGQGTEP
jgi:hypothetical protein